jgi:hypothetical protein
VINRSQQDINQQKPIAEARAAEERYFSQHLAYRYSVAYNPTCTIMRNTVLKGIGAESYNGYASCNVLTAAGGTFL